MVPVNIMIPKGVKLDGTNPCLVTGYGGYGVNRVPTFVPERRILFDHGFIVAEANLRGGGEYGEAWHKAGNLTNKQNVFDDFAAVLQLMIDGKYTSPEHLAIMGGSNGGLLMGATLTQHPGLMKAVVSFVGIYDMLRVELSPNGAFNVPEFGTVKDEKQFRAMLAYSPYHHVKDGDEVSGGAVPDGGQRPARRSDAVAQDDGPACRRPRRRGCRCCCGPAPAAATAWTRRCRSASRSMWMCIHFCSRNWACR